MKILSYKKYKFFQFFRNINFFVTGNGESRLSEDKLAYFDNLINVFFQDVIEARDFDVILKLLLNLMGYFLVTQPFYDGNTRTVIIFMKIFLERYHYLIDLDVKDFRSIIPIFYSEDELCDENDVLKLKKKLVQYK